MNKELNLGIFISLLIHIFVVILFPGFPRPVINKINYIEIEFIPSEEIFSLKRDKKDYIKGPKTDLKPLIQKAEELGSKRMMRSFTKLKLPAISSREKNQIRVKEYETQKKKISKILEELSYKTNMLDKGISSLEGFPDKEMKKVPTGLFNKEELAKRELLTEEIDKKSIEEKEIEPIYEKIKGPVAKRRRVVYKPPLPTDSEAEGEIELKFWVLPDGTVGRIVALKRGNPQLEDEAIRYLKKWKFNSLSNKTEKEEWGIIPLRFILK